MKKIVVMAVLGLVCSPGFASTYYWTNAESGNDFSVLGNWNLAADGSNTTIVGNLNGDALRINKTGADKAVLSSALTDIPTSVSVGTGAGLSGEMQVVSGGSVTLGGATVGTGDGASGILSMTGGTLGFGTGSLTVGANGASGTVSMSDGLCSLPLNFTTIANSNQTGLASSAILNISGGTFNTDRITLAQQFGDTGTMNITGGTVNVLIGDPTPTISTGAIRALGGEGFLNISGNGVVNVQTVCLAARLTITMNGGEFNASGYYKPAGYTGDDTPVTKTTFDFNETMIANGLVKGKVEYNAGLFKVAGDQASLLDAVIAAGNIYTTVEGMAVDAQYDSVGNFTTLALVIPEPATLAILGLGSLFLVRRK